MARRPHPPRAGAGGPGDTIDRVIAEWQAELPDLPVAPIEVLARLGRLRTRFDDELADVFARHDLTSADFTVIVSLRRAGAPFTLPQSVLMARLGLTSGTVSVRLSRLESKGVVTRSRSATDGRGVLVTLTPTGVDLFDRVAPQHLANEDVLLSALTGEERVHLAGLLRKLLVGFEHPSVDLPAGFTVAAAHLTRRARAAVGLSDLPGLLVEDVAPCGRAEAGGLQAGDVVVGTGDRELRSAVDLAEVAAEAGATGLPLRLRVVRGEVERDLTLGP